MAAAYCDMLSQMKTSVSEVRAAETQSARETPRLPSGSEGRAVGFGTATCCLKYRIKSGFAGRRNLWKN